MESLKSQSTKSDSLEEFIDEEKLISSEELQTEFENLKKTVNDKCAQSENCLFLKKLSILRKYNDSRMNVLCSEYFNGENETSSNITLSSSSSEDLKSKKNSLGSQNVSKSILLENEEILHKHKSAIFLHKSQLVEGDFLLTNYKILFNPKNGDFFTTEFILPDFLQIPYTFIHCFTKKKETTNKNGFKYIIKFQIRDRPAIQIAYKSKREYLQTVDTVTEMINPKSINAYFAFKYNKKYDNIEFGENENGWSIYQHLLEYIRLGVNTEKEDCDYRMYIQELHGYLCETYPNFVYIHKKVTNEELVKVASFRSKKRFPALVWNSPFNRASLWRSSQAKTGFIDKRSIQDELFFELLSKETEKLHIYDARPYINALANKMKGMGFENTDNYKNAQIIFCDIENIHCVRQAYNKVKIISQLPLEGYDMWLMDLHQTGWLQIIGRIIRSAVNVASSLMENATVLVHCSDGWDRTAQLTSLAQVIVDPYYRTIMGLIVLIEKEWISFGHQFALRCGHTIPKDEDNISPIFIQWLDCLHQLLHQFPKAFEYNNDLLLFLAFHVNSCLYGTFLTNNEIDRLSNFIKFKTVSIWTDVIFNKSKFVNPEYQENKSSITTLTPSCALYKLRLWQEHFLRWNPYYVMNNNHSLSPPYV